MTANTTAEGRKTINDWYKAVTKPEANSPNPDLKLLCLVGPAGSGKRTLARALKDAVEREQESICSVFTETTEAPVDVAAVRERYPISPTILVLVNDIDTDQDSRDIKGSLIVKMPAIAEPGNHERIYRELRRQVMNGGL